MPIWSTYVAIDDADLLAGRVERAGGQVVVPPFEVFDRGRMAIFADPAGATFSVWQTMAMPGAEVFNVPGAMAWNELVTPDPVGAKVFYELVFGWHPDDQPMGTITRTSWRLGAQIVAGIVPPLGDDFPADSPAYWSVYFAVVDAEPAARAGELGGTILVPPQDIPAGRYAALRDPQCALFNVIALASPGAG